MNDYLEITGGVNPEHVAKVRAKFPAADGMDYSDGWAVRKSSDQWSELIASGPTLAVAWDNAATMVDFE